jgi:hypothetical protein
VNEKCTVEWMPWKWSRFLIGSGRLGVIVERLAMLPMARRKIERALEHGSIDGFAASALPNLLDRLADHGSCYHHTPEAVEFRCTGSPNFP